jgi:hypothetical protein
MLVGCIRGGPLATPPPLKALRIEPMTHDRDAMHMDVLVGRRVERKDDAASENPPLSAREDPGERAHLLEDMTARLLWS